MAIDVALTLVAGVIGFHPCGLGSAPGIGTRSDKAAWLTSEEREGEEEVVLLDEGMESFGRVSISVKMSCLVRWAWRRLPGRFRGLFLGYWEIS